MKFFVFLSVIFYFISLTITSAQSKVIINIGKPDSVIKISPNVYGQFIEYLGNSITNGIFEEGSDLSDSSNNLF